jgi:hypothetical protein
LKSNQTNQINEIQQKTQNKMGKKLSFPGLCFAKREKLSKIRFFGISHFAQFIVFGLKSLHPDK